METTECPVCDRKYHVEEIEHHVNNCLFLNSNTDSLSTRKRLENQASPRPTKLARRSPGAVNIAKKRSSFVSSDIDTVPKPTTSSHSSTCDTAPVEDKTVEKKTYSFDVPLAEALRPSVLGDFVGQEQTVGRGSIMRKLLDGASIPSVILWGPPGCGKTTLANVIKEILVQHGKKNGKPVRFTKLCATMAGVADVKEIINVAKNELRLFQKRTVLFMDEIHRFNKSQQDTFLPHIESGTITLIGATTENPSFSLNNALLSRCRVITMEKLSIENIYKILHRAVDHVGGSVTSKNDTAENEKWSIDSETIQWLAEISDGDARIALNSLQMAIESKQDLQSRITLNDIRDNIKKSHILYDKKGEEHYNLISAMIKSIRASDDNAALYWMTRMLEAGEDPMYIARRLVRHASEDIGLADPHALVLAVSTLHGCQVIGMPECDVLLAELTIYLARCPKSVEAYNALNKARSFISNHKGALPSVPLHLRNAPTKLMKNLGYGKGYNKEQKGLSGLQYMPEGFENVSFFDQDME